MVLVADASVWRLVFIRGMRAETWQREMPIESLLARLYSFDLRASRCAFISSRLDADARVACDDVRRILLPRFRVLVVTCGESSKAMPDFEMGALCGY